MKDLANNIKTFQTIAPAAITATTTGVTVDRIGYESVTFAINVGVLTTCDTDDYMTFKVQESADDSTWTDVATANLINPTSWDLVLNATTEGSQVYRIGVKTILATSRYFRVVATETAGGTSFNGIFGAVAILSTAALAPVTT